MRSARPFQGGHDNQDSARTDEPQRSAGKRPTQAQRHEAAQEHQPAADQQGPADDLVDTHRYSVVGLADASGTTVTAVP